MSIPLILIILLSVFVFYCIRDMIHRGDDIHAYFFGALYIYTIFTQIGYVYYPEFSSELCYYGIDAFYGYWMFIFLSFISCYFFYKKLPKNKKGLFAVKKSFSKRGGIKFYILSFILTLLCAVYFIRNKEKFGWGGGINMGDAYFVLLFRVFTSLTFIQYVVLRTKFKKIRLLLFIFSIAVFGTITMAAGNRTDLLAFFVAVVFFELTPFNITLKRGKIKILLYGVITCFFIQFLLLILELRNYTNNINIANLIELNSEYDILGKVDIAESIIKQDYYAPSHELFIAIHYQFINPIITIYSNICNTLIGLRQPYLSDYILALTNIHFERGVGWAFYMYIEGFCFAGWLGFLYNGLVWNIILNFIIRMTKCNNPLMSKMIYAYIAYFIISWTRSQSCIMIQSIWFMFVPFIILSAWALNLKITITK